MTPYEKALKKREKKTCITCSSRTVVNGASYCKKDGKLLHPMLLEPPYGGCPIDMIAHATSEEIETPIGYETDAFTPNQMEEFVNLINPVCKWLQKNGHPHMKVIVLPTYAEIVEGLYACYVDREENDE